MAYLDDGRSIVRENVRVDRCGKSWKLLDEMPPRHALSLQQPLTKEAAGDRGMSGARTQIFI